MATLASFGPSGAGWTGSTCGCGPGEGSEGGLGGGHTTCQDNSPARRCSPAAARRHGNAPGRGRPRTNAAWSAGSSKPCRLDRAHRPAPQHAGQARHMVGVEVGEHDQRDPGDAERAQAAVDRAAGSGPASTTTPVPSPAASTMASPCPTSHITSRQPGGGQPVITRVSGGGCTTTSSQQQTADPAPPRMPRASAAGHEQHHQGRRPRAAPRPPNCPASPRPRRAAPPRSGRPPRSTRRANCAHHARALATGIATGAVASAANPSTVAGAIANSASRLHGTATRLTRADSTATTGAHRACAAAAAASASASRGGTPRRRSAALHRGASVSSAPGGQRRRAGTRNSAPATGRTAPAAVPPSPAPGSATSGGRSPGPAVRPLRRPRPAARSDPVGTPRRTRVRAHPPSTAVARREMPRRGASPRRSTCCARPGGPSSSARRIVKLAPETASVCVRSVSLKASSSSGVIREVSPTTSPGNSARASAGSPSVASRSPARNRPASRCAPEGSPTTSGSP